MARNRMLNPDFWFDEEVSNLTPHARLLYMGLWGICDDNYATLPNKPNWIKAQIFPYEEIDASLLIEELINIKKLIPFIYEDSQYLFIKNFFKHQKVEKPSRPKYPKYKSLDEESGSSRGVVDAKEVSKISKKEDFSNEKSPLIGKTKEMNKYNEKESSDSHDLVVDMETGEAVSRSKKHEPKNKVALQLIKVFGLMAKDQLGVTPIKDSKGYFITLDAMKYLKAKQIVELFKVWFSAGYKEDETMQITRALSHRNINKFKIENGIKD